jgi:hypothetical protein
MNAMNYKIWTGIWAVLAIVGSGGVLASRTSAGSAGPPAAPAAVAPATSSRAQVSGFVVDVVNARADGFHVDVDVQIIGKESAGEQQVFTPGPVLLAPGGAPMQLVSGSIDGRRMTLRFDRPDGVLLHSGDALTLRMFALTPRDAAPDQAEGVPPAPHADALARLSAASNASVRPVSARAALGPATAVVRSVAVDGTSVRFSGHLDGLSQAELQVATLAGTVLVAADGTLSKPSSLRAGFGPDGSSFEFDFEQPPAAGAQLRLALSANASPNVPDSAVARLLPLRAVPAEGAIAIPGLGAP